MRTLVPLFIAAVVSVGSFVLVAQAPPGGGGKGGGKGKAPRENLKVLPDDANLVPTMQMFVAALGLADKGGCNYCHDPAQGASKASDANPKKLTARMMISMAKDINSKFPDGKEHVTCYTCHRGSTAPLTAAP
jgi:photosynthetic reaction center cytochrome c subunit